ncbi:HD-GYP domain-containing protein [Peribacillus alkalitolerans]|uniref:HD-GYP domain-containing protein n=1 Tax=Peribacillus alkalitolerans TaxID=1550385 RepID=UPI0013D5F381|nr:HD domain-containing phosphohydrolase [Peribacillus alkalitolerans]
MDKPNTIKQPEWENPLRKLYRYPILVIAALTLLLTFIIEWTSYQALILAISISFTVLIVQIYQSHVRLEKKNKQHKEHIFHLLNTLVPLVEGKSRTTRNEIHYTSSLMKKLSFTMPEIKVKAWEIELLALLHYVSRVQWPEYIFEKDERLTHYEFGIVKEHCQLGSKLLGEFTEFNNVKHWFLAHHERIDGSGYPKGLKTNEIPPISQVLGIVETYLAMTSKKPYREALSYEAVISELRNLQDVKFDKHLIQQFIFIISEDERVGIEKTRLGLISKTG